MSCASKAARGLDNRIVDGEICFVRPDGVTDFSALQSAMKSDRTGTPTYFALDLLFLGDQAAAGSEAEAGKKKAR